MTRFVVLERCAPGAAEQAAAEIAAQLGDGQARVVRGWRRPPAGAPVVCVGEVRSGADAAAAVMCAVAGSGVVVEAAADREVIDRLCDDLRHLGSLDHRIGSAGAAALPEDESRLLGLLLGGATLGQAAQALHMSRRTADRRLAAARRRLGAGSTSEAVAAAARLGVRPAPRRP